VKPNYCYFCSQPASVEDGRNSFLVDCPHCGVKYEMDCTAWAAEARDKTSVLTYVRGQIDAGHARPTLTVEDMRR
jgi:hypothetical protein